VDPLLARTLFWYTGHPIVYFWLLPAYAILYLVLPKLAGGKLISDPLARVVFLLFLLFSVPVGFHHQYADPGIDPTWKFVHAVLTLFVAVPSLITAFTVAASLELAGRMRGGKGLFGWIKALPWDNPAFVAPVLGLIAFIPGGAGGIVNASYTLNYVVHNTAWVPGHFHLQVGTLVTMTMMGAVFWLVPQLTGKPLTEGIRKAGLAGVWLWFVGMLVMAVGMHWQGLLNVPRRAYIAQAPDAYTHAAVPMVFNILAGIILLLAIDPLLLRPLRPPPQEGAAGRGGRGGGALRRGPLGRRGQPSHAPSGPDLVLVRPGRPPGGPGLRPHLGAALRQPEPRARLAALVKGCASRARGPWPLSFLPP
jgi:cytochrome c oxidase subunit I